jgi:hypothetical protein
MGFALAAQEFPEILEHCSTPTRTARVTVKRAVEVGFAPIAMFVAILRP